MRRQFGPLLPVQAAAWFLAFTAAGTAFAESTSQLAAKSKLSPSEIAGRVTASVVTIVTPSGTGSGVVVDSTGTIITNLHVLRGDAVASVKLPNGDVYDDVQVIDVDARKDIVLIRIKAFGLRAAPIGDSDRVKTGDRVVLLGSPRGLQSTLTDGLISSVRESGDGYKLFQTSAAASPGSSGGGLFNDAGELVGILSLKQTNAENINFAVPINYVRGMLGQRTAGYSLAELARRYPAEPTSPAEAGDVTTASAQGKDRIGRAVRDSGLEFTESGSGWSTTFKGEHAKAITVFVTLYGDLATVQSQTIWSTALSQSQLNRLMLLNFDHDLGKLGITENRLVALTELEIRGLDGTALKHLANSVAVLADDAYGLLVGDSEESTTATTYSALTGPGPLARPEAIDLLGGTAALRFDGVEWTRFRNADDPPDVLQYRQADGELFFKLLPERIEVALDKFEPLFLSQIRGTDPKAKILKRGKRTVNGRTLMVLEVEAEVSGISFVFVNHIYSSSAGTIQILMWTGRNLVSEKRAAIDKLVAGFQVRR